MLSNPLVSEDAINRAMSELARLRRFSGSPAEFWPAFLGAAGALCGAAKATLALRDPQANQWKKLSEWAGAGSNERVGLSFTRELINIAERAAREGGSAIQALEATATAGLSHYIIGVRLSLNRPEDLCVAAFLVLNATEQQAQEAAVRLKLVSDTPQSYLMSSAATQARTDVEKFAASLDLMVSINAEKVFLAAGLALCNGLATRYSCDRVSLGWLEKGYIRVRSISRTERFDKNMAAIKAIENVMEEAFDQDEEILWPAPEDAQVVSRDHEKFAREQSSGHLVSVPVRIDGAAVAVITFERASRHFSQTEIQQFRLAADQASRRLHDLHEQEGWAGKRAARVMRKKLATYLGPENTWAKFTTIVATIFVLFSLLIPIRYRVEGTFILRSDDVSFLTAPFDGYIQKVNSRPGDSVAASATLLQLDDQNLRLQEAEAIADQARFLREAERARATNALADMRISIALAEQAKARLDLVRYNLSQANIKSPVAGVVIEGDLRERIGAPVKQGDPLFKVASMSSLYVEAEVNQRDIQDALEAVKNYGGKAEIAFVTQPKLKFPVTIERIEPAAFPKEGENVFLVRCKLDSAAEQWWRPGMSGLVKIESGRRTLAWVMTHRTIDFLRLKLWW
ncbi:MAG TPA: HlyD family efflux transporter periplasmic adaptor subunit [Methylomirabilota bacterium]|nr:HlyD family efflux transporter periplasmic adaptor subunit [Methylomirabilota bacterium]